MGEDESVDLVEMYRDLMAAVNIATQPLQAIERGFYVPRSNFSIKELATQFLLEPQSTHLLVGGIGSGKTTELLNARETVERGKGTKVVYIDVAEKHRLSELRPGVLISIVALELVKYLTEKQQNKIISTIKYIDNTANGMLIDSAEAYAHTRDDEDEYEFFPGILAPPGPTNHLVTTIGKALCTILSELRKEIPNFIVFFDSLDRIHEPQKLNDVVKEDVLVLKQSGVGVLLIGPLSALYGENRSLLNYFDQYSFLPDVDPETDEAGFAFLFNVLRRRVPEVRIDNFVCNELVMMSGGILRDLLKLTKGAAQRAFMSDSTHVSSQHVRAAAEVEGRKLLFGLTQEAMEKLQALAQGKDFTLVTKEDLLLIEHRRVIQYQESEGQTRYVLHPTLRPLLSPDNGKKAGSK